MFTIMEMGLSGTLMRDACIYLVVCIFLYFAPSFLEGGNLGVVTGVVGVPLM